MSRSESEPDSASLRQRKWPVCQIMTKPDIDGEATGKSSHRTFRGGWGRRVWDRSAEEPGRPAVFFAGVGQPIVAGKRGNDRGAKGLSVNVQL